MKTVSLLALIFLLLFFAGMLSRAEIITYKAPKGGVAGGTISVRVRQDRKAWQNVDTYSAPVANIQGTKNPQQSTFFASFDFSGKVEVALSASKVSQAGIRPLSLQLMPVIKGNTILFSLDKTQNLSIETDGDIFGNLHLFANPIETERPKPFGPDVLYYGPGLHHAGLVHVPSGKIVYFAGSAIVQGTSKISKAANVRIAGRGILTQLVPRPGDTLTKLPSNGRNDVITIGFSSNVEVSGPGIIPLKYSMLIA
jgi:hypothetical protein